MRKKKKKNFWTFKYFFPSEIFGSQLWMPHITLPLSDNSDAWDQTRLHRSFSSYLLKTSKDGACAASLGNLSDCLTVFCGGKVSSYIQSEPLISICVSFLLFSCCSLLWRPQLHILDGPPYVQTCFPCSRVADRFPHRHPFSRLKEPSCSHLFSQGKCSILVALCWPHSSLTTSFLYCGGQKQMQYSVCEMIIAK